MKGSTFQFLSRGNRKRVGTLICLFPLLTNINQSGWLFCLLSTCQWVSNPCQLMRQSHIRLRQCNYLEKITAIWKSQPGDKWRLPGSVKGLERLKGTEKTDMENWRNRLLLVLDPFPLKRSNLLNASAILTVVTKVNVVK